MDGLIVILYVKNQNKAKEFYEISLGLKPVLDVPGMTEFQLLNGVKLGLMPEEGIYKILKGYTPDPALGNGIPRCELYLMVDNPEECLKKALSAGAKSVSDVQPRNWGDVAGYCIDPDGHVIAFAKKM